MATIKDTSFTRYENSYFTFYKENCLSFSNLDIVVFSKYTNCPGCWTQYHGKQDVFVAHSIVPLNEALM